ncbi:MAG: C40 family peptidase [bacterium]|nr:C40 family peptidase [bacterium]
MERKQADQTREQIQSRAGRRIRRYFGLYLFLGILAVGASHRASADLWISKLYAVGLPDGASELAEILRVAESLEGRPYLYGGSDEDGFDCSGFTYYVYGRAGYRIPRTVREQFHGLVSIDQPRPGDLVFFAIEPENKAGDDDSGLFELMGAWAGSATHVGIYMGGDRFIHAPRTGGKVRIESLETPYWKDRLRGSRTVIVPELADSDFAEE